MLQKMTLEEKVQMLHGFDGGYVGNVQPNTRLGIPVLNLNDGPQGFRVTSKGGTTAFPSGLTVGATFDQDLALQFGAAMGEEFFGKGSNVQLGPGVCLARVPTNGRNFEYISGEDPFLGYTMVQPVIKGIQSKNVIACTKHYVMNNQETDRGDVNAVVDERTRFEMYYPPFEGAIAAGSGSIMCSYNKINGRWACENNETLQRDYKERLGFEGFVMSDWGATHSTSIMQGLDMQMPDASYFGAPLLNAVQSGTIPLSAVDNSVLRILTQMYKFGIFDHPDQWNRTTHQDADVTSPAHSLVARKISAASSVLLKNDKNILPLKAGTKIALIGTHAVSPIVGGGGSGSVVPTYIVTPFDGIFERDNGRLPPQRNCTSCNFEADKDYMSSSVSGTASSKEDCCQQCGVMSSCVKFTFIPGNTCWFHLGDGTYRDAPGATTGSCSSAPPPASNVTFSSGLDLNEAAQVAAAADVAIVFLTSSSSEGGDRSSLSFPDGQDAMVTVVANAQPNTIVVMVAPGAALLPWSKDVQAIIHMFMPGLEMGHALADVLFGDVNPSGRLPITLPNFENEIGFTPEMYPGVNLTAVYSEKLLVGYRWYDAKGITPLFPFGHGLSYTSFAYSNLNVQKGAGAGEWTVTVDVANSGPVSGAEVVQLYLGFPAAAGEPPSQLKGFSKIVVSQGAKQTVTFNLKARDLSIWDVGSTAWTVVPGQFRVMVGASSRDIRATGTINQS